MYIRMCLSQLSGGLVLQANIGAFIMTHLQTHVHVGRASAWYAEHRGVESRLRQSLLFLLRKRELSSGVVALLCLVSMTDRSCTYTYALTNTPPRDLIQWNSS